MKIPELSKSWPWLPTIDDNSFKYLARYSHKSAAEKMQEALAVFLPHFKLVDSEEDYWGGETELLVRSDRSFSLSEEDGFSINGFFSRMKTDRRYSDEEQEVTLGAIVDSNGTIVWQQEFFEDDI